MSYEREQYMRRQEADHDLIRMRTQPVQMKRPENWSALSANQILAAMTVEQLREGERRALNGLALVEAERAAEPVYDPKMVRTHGGRFEAGMEADLSYREHMYRSALFDVRQELLRRGQS